PWLPLLPVPAPFIKLQMMQDIPTLSSLQRLEKLCTLHILEYRSVPQSAAHQEWLDKLQKRITEAAATARHQSVLIKTIESLCEQFSEIEYDFLLERSTGLLRIG